MNIEENVREETTQTEEVAAAKESVETQEKEALTVLGKFKDVDALAKAYESLQAEFTRRSQKLRTLEKEVENFKEASASGVEKLRKTAQARREEAKAFDEFLSTAIEGGQSEKPTLKEGLEDVEKGEEELLHTGENSSEKGVGETAKSEERLSSNELFQRAFQDEGVRLKIVGEYLNSLGKTGAPVTGKGVGVYLTPPRKARTLGQAADMALLYLKKPVQ